MTLHSTMIELGRRARKGAQDLANVSAEAKNQALLAIAQALRANAEKILAANQQDLKQAQEHDYPAAFIKRLTLDQNSVEAMAKGVETIASFPDPIGSILAEWDRPNGLHISRVRVPLGVIGVIYESRPNVTIDAAALCFKAGNAAILRGGSESYHSSSAIMECIIQGLESASISPDCIQMVPTTDREAVGELLKMDEYIDVIVPRGGKSLIQRITAESRIPLFKHLEGICHSYIHKAADKAMAIELVHNAKLRSTGICGATETVLIDVDVAKEILPDLIADLHASGCEIRGDEEVQAINSVVLPATEEDWDKEYLDAIIAIKVVPNLDAAIKHINQHGSHHTDAIVTNDDQAASRFLNEVDSAIVMLNSSTQFADGGEFGMGAEIGIATGKLHARGPVGIEQLTTFKYQVRGSGQTRP